MNTGKLNNQASWKEKLSSLQVQDVSAHDFQASWHKLASRLEPTKKAPFLSLYWVAAACILIAICSAIIFSVNNHNASSNDSIVKNTNHQLNQSSRTAHNKFKDDLEEKKLPVIAKKAARPQMKHLLKHISRILAAEEQLPDTQISMIQDSLVALAPQSIVPEKNQRLRVVHINEIGTLLQEQRVVAQGSRESSSSIFPHNGSEDLIKIKILPSN